MSQQDKVTVTPLQQLNNAPIILQKIGPVLAEMQATLEGRAIKTKVRMESSDSEGPANISIVEGLEDGQEKLLAVHQVRGVDCKTDRVFMAYKDGVMEFVEYVELTLELAGHSID